MTYHFTAPAYVNGTQVGSEWLPQPVEVVAGSIPVDLQSKHIWNETVFPSFQSEQAVNAKTQCGAKGDGITDDHAALQVGMLCSSTRTRVWYNRCALVVVVVCFALQNQSRRIVVV